jgi:hypothetical protein
VWRIGIGLRGLRDQQCAKGGGSECNSRVTVGAGRQCQFRSFVRGDYCSLLLSFLRGYRFQFRLTGPVRLSVPIYLLPIFLYHKLLYSSITSQLDSPINTYIYVPIKMEKNLATYSTSLVTKQLRPGGGANIKRSVGVSPRPRRWSVGNNGIVFS